MDNIDFFNRFTVALLAKLSSSFPTPIDPKISSICEEVISSNEVSDEEWYNHRKSAEHAVQFLIDEGFIRASTLGGFDGKIFHNVQLTMKAWSILGEPSSLESKESIASKMKSIASDGIKSAASESIASLISVLFAAAKTHFL